MDLRFIPLGLLATVVLVPLTTQAEPRTSQRLIQVIQGSVANPSELPITADLTPSLTNRPLEPVTLDDTLNQLQRYSREGRQNTSQPQVTSVSQLADVQPTDWAFQALQSLVERYGCIAGYPDGTFKGNRALTRYEFAAGVNACLERIQELLNEATADRMTQNELIALQRLQNEFAAELALLRGQIKTLEDRTETLIANQFSTTTKLQGEVIFALTDDWVEAQSDANQAVFQSRVRLDLNTSFSGKDLLLTRLQAGNADTANLGATREATQTFNVRGDSDTEFELERLLYQFPVGDQLYLTFAATGVTWDDFVPTLNPYLEDYDGGQGTLSAFGQRHPIYRLGGGTGVGLTYAFDDSGLGTTALSVGYLASGAAEGNDGQGLFNGNSALLAQVTVAPTDNLQFAFTYNHAYFTPGNFGFDSGSYSDPNALNGFTGTGIANSLLGLTELGLTAENPTGKAKAVVSNSYGVQFAWQIDPGVILSAWGGYTAARAIGVGDGGIWTYALNFGFPDLFQEGSLGGIVIGREPYLDKFDTDLDIDFPQDSSWHFEVFYRYQATDNISITPGFIWITSPNQDSHNNDLFIGTIRTTFRF